MPEVAVTALPGPRPFVRFADIFPADGEIYPRQRGLLGAVLN